MRKLALYGIILIAAHIVTVSWHLLALAHIQSGFTTARILRFATLVSVLPAVAAVLLWTSLQRLRAIFMFAALGFGFVVGVYEHFLASGPGNIFQLAPGDWATSFRTSAIVLLMLEIGGCWTAWRLLDVWHKRQGGGQQSILSYRPRH